MKKSKGFTLIELVIVIVIIGILAIIAVPLYRGYTRRAMASEANAFAGSIANAQKIYFAEHSQFLAVGTTSDQNTDLSIDPRANKYFQEYTIDSNNNTNDAAEFYVTINAIPGSDADGLYANYTGYATAPGTYVLSGL